VELRGIIAPVLTPFTSDGRVDLGALERIVEYTIEECHADAIEAAAVGRTISIPGAEAKDRGPVVSPVRRDGGVSPQGRVMPPLTWMVWPVMYSLSGPRRKSVGPTRSSGSPIRCLGIVFPTFFLHSTRNSGPPR